MNEDKYADGVIDVDLGGYVEPEIVDGEALSATYTLRLVDMNPRDVQTKNGEVTVVDFLFKITDSGLTNPKPVRYSIWLSRSTDTPEQKNATKGRIIRFKKAFGMSDEDARAGGLAKTELLGGDVQATLKKIVDDEYGDKNEIKRLYV